MGSELPFFPFCHITILFLSSSRWHSHFWAAGKCQLIHLQRPENRRGEVTFCQLESRTNLGWGKTQSLSVCCLPLHHFFHDNQPFYLGDNNNGEITSNYKQKAKIQLYILNGQYVSYTFFNSQTRLMRCRERVPDRQGRTQGPQLE